MHTVKSQPVGKDKVVVDHNSDVTGMCGLTRGVGGAHQDIRVFGAERQAQAGDLDPVHDQAQPIREGLGVKGRGRDQGNLRAVFSGHFGLR